MTGNLAKALAAVQAALPTVHKGKTANVGQYKYDYADLADVTVAVMPLLAKHGLAFTCHPRAVERGGYELAATLMHESGESITGALPVAGTAQQLGSALTYARRYLLGCMTGVVTDSDDDARLATEAAKANRREVHQQAAAETAPAITEAQSRKLHALVRERGLDRERKIQLARWATGGTRDVESTSELTRAEAAKAIDFLEQMEPAQQEEAS